MFHFSVAQNAPKSRSVFVRGVPAALASIILVLAAQSISAATYTVTTTADSGAGSLRQAVLDANATVDNDTIDFNIPAASCNATTGVCTITLSSTEIVIANNGSLTINGTGADRLTIDGGAGTNRIFYSNAATFTLSGVTLTGGNGRGTTPSNDGAGGAILAEGAAGVLALTNVHITGNTATVGPMSGGGLALMAGTVNISGSTFSANNASCGAGLSTNGVTLRITNSTFSNNTATNVGGAMCLQAGGGSTFRNLTIANNTANNAGGGIYTFNHSFNFANTIVAGNTGANSNPEFLLQGSVGTATSAGYNLVGDAAGDSTGTGMTITYQTTDIRDTPPRLAPLANYGGPTPTRWLYSDSPAIDKGGAATDPITNAPITTDQRGFTRPVDLAGYPNATGGNGSDIGAFEGQIAPATASGVSISGRVMTAEGRGLRSAMVILTDPEGVTRSVATGRGGYYRFEDVEAGATYVLGVSSRRFQFVEQTINVSDSIAGVDFVPSGYAAPSRSGERSGTRRGR